MNYFAAVNSAAKYELFTKKQKIMITKTYTYKGYEIQRKKVVEFDGTKWIPTKQYEIYSCGYMIPMITDTLKEAKAEINRRIEMFGN